MSTQAGDSAYALLADGTTIEIRPARPDDFDAVRDMHEKMSPDNLYLRFFSMSSVAAGQAARRICREPAPDHAALLAVLDGEVVGYGIYERLGAGSPSAEVAMAVADDMHNRGVGTLLLEHLISLARGQGVRTFIAETLTENALMLQVFADAGLPAQRALADGVYDFTFPLPADETDAALGTYRDAVAERERSADVASLQHVLTPASVAVIGASRRPGSVGRAILQNIITGGFSGPVYAVNPSVAELDGVPCVPSAAALPEQVDLAIIATPAAAVARCRRRMRAAGGQGPGRGHGGPGRRRPGGTAGHLPPLWHAAGRAHLLRRGQPQRFPGRDVRGPPSQAGKGRPGAAVRRRRRRSARAPVPAGRRRSPPPSRSATKTTCPATTCCCGGRPDEATKLAVLYLASFGNPRKFARTARGVSRTMPVLTVNVGRSARPAPGLGSPAGGRAPGHCSRRGGGQPAAHQAGPVRAGRCDRHRQPR